MFPILGKATLILGFIATIGGCAAPPPRDNTSVMQVKFDFSPQDQGASYKKIERGAIAGSPQHVGFYYSINPDCTLNGLVKMQVKEPPAHGAVAFANADGYTSFPASSTASECNKKKSPGIEVMYTADKDFAGTDKFAVQAIGPNGKYMETEYTVKVLAPK